MYCEVTRSSPGVFVGTVCRVVGSTILISLDGKGKPTLPGTGSLSRGLIATNPTSVEPKT